MTVGLPGRCPKLAFGSRLEMVRIGFLICSIAVEVERFDLSFDCVINLLFVRECSYLCCGAGD